MRSKNPKLRAYLEKKAESGPSAAPGSPLLDFMLRGKAVAKDPDGKQIWLLLEPKTAADTDTVH